MTALVCEEGRLRMEAGNDRADTSERHIWHIVPQRLWCGALSEGRGDVQRAGGSGKGTGLTRG